MRAAAAPDSPRRAETRPPQAPPLPPLRVGGGGGKERGEGAGGWAGGRAGGPKPSPPPGGPGATRGSLTAPRAWRGGARGPPRAGPCPQPGVRWTATARLFLRACGSAEPPPAGALRRSEPDPFVSFALGERHRLPSGRSPSPGQLARIPLPALAGEPRVKTGERVPLSWLSGARGLRPCGLAPALLGGQAAPGPSGKPLRAAGW